MPPQIRQTQCCKWEDSTKGWPPHLGTLPRVMAQVWVWTVAANGDQQRAHSSLPRSRAAGQLVAADLSNLHIHTQRRGCGRAEREGMSKIKLSYERKTILGFFVFLPKRLHFPKTWFQHQEIWTKSGLVLLAISVWYLQLSLRRGEGKVQTYSVLFRAWAEAALKAGLASNLNVKLLACHPYYFNLCVLE